VRRALPIAAPAGASAPPAILPRGLIEPIPNIMLSNAHRSATLAAFKTAQ
jgi:hypothetical protein